MKHFLVLLLVFLPLSFLNSQVTINVPGDYSTIQAAINAANTGDLVLVADGTYQENINFKGKAITVASHFINDGDTSHIFNTIIDGSNPAHPDTGSVVIFSSGEDTTSVLKGFTIRNGTGSVAPTPGYGGGGGIYIFNSGALISNNIIENNSINFANAVGGGIGVGMNGSSTTILKYNIIRNNTVLGSYIAFGGGIYLSHNGPTYIENNIISSNSVEAADYPLGGGIELVSCGFTFIQSNRVTDNQAIGTYASGGGIDLNESIGELFIHNNLIKGNSTTQTTIMGGGGIDLYSWENTVELTNNVIVENTGYKGGGVLIEYTGDRDSKNLTPIDPQGPRAIPRIINNTIAHNSGEIGGGFHIQNSPTPDIMNNIVWGNTYNSGGQISGTANVSWSDVEGGYTGTGNIDSLPLFISSEYYLLDPASPCIDAGNPDPMYNDVEDPYNPGFALYPAMGTIRNDIGTFGGPNSVWYDWPWPIPVELTSFTAYVQLGKVNLHWTTSTETNNFGFEIERRIIDNQGEWVTIGFREGYGTTTEKQEYFYSDDISGLSATSFAYRLRQIDFDGSYDYSDEVLVDNPAPLNYDLEQNYPNPFNPTTTISYSLPVTSQVEIIIYNALGESVLLLVNEVKESGHHSVELNATILPSGVYFYRLQAGEYAEVKKMMLLK